MEAEHIMLIHFKSWVPSTGMGMDKMGNQYVFRACGFCFATCCHHILTTCDGSKSDSHGLESLTYHFLAVWPGARSMTSLNLSIFSCTRGMPGRVC